MKCQILVRFPQANTVELHYSRIHYSRKLHYSRQFAVAKYVVYLEQRNKRKMRIF